MVPWNYLSTAPPVPDAPANDDAAAMAISSVAPPMSEKAKGKRRAIDVMAEAAERMQTPSPVETAAPSPPATTPQPENAVEDFHRKHREARQLRNEREYGEMLDSIIL